MKFSADNPFAQPQPANPMAQRLAVAMLIALTVHLAAIFSLDWELKQTPELSQSLDVTLVSFSSQTATGPAPAEKKPNAANSDDNLPNVDRPLMGDDAPDVDRPSTADNAPNANRPSTADDASDVGRPFMGDNNATSKPAISDRATAAPAPSTATPSINPAPPKPAAAAAQPTPKPAPPPKQPAPAASQPKAAAKPLAFGRDQLSASLAGIQAENAFARQQPNQGSRISRHHQATSKRDISAWYRDAWRKKVERIGNLNYPEEARRQGLYGNLRVMVLINRDGSLQQMRILESSGHKVLDQAALNIVRLSAPFAPFSNELAAQYEQVEIIRTWRFERGDRLSSQ